MENKGQFLNNQDGKPAEKLMEKSSDIQTLGFMALAVFFCAVGFGTGSLLYTAKLIDIEQIFVGMLIGPGLFGIWFLFKGK